MLLSVDRVSKRFGGLTAVREVSLEVAAGDLVGIIGPNGAGKTTLFNVISGFYPADGGVVRFDGQEISGHPPHEVCRLGVCRTFQIVKPFGNLTVLQNVTIGALTRLRHVAQARAEARRVVELTGLADYQEVAAKSLPGALRKRLEVARALATQPRLLLLDEAMAGLTPTEMQSMLALIRRLHAGGLTLLVIEHVMAAIMPLCRWIVVLHHGEKISEGPPPEVARDPRVIDAYLGEEFALA